MGKSCLNLIQLFIKLTFSRLEFVLWNANNYCNRECFGSGEPKLEAVASIISRRLPACRLAGQK